MVSKRQLIVENERLRSEVGYLRGRVEELEGQPAEMVNAVGEIVKEFFNSMRPPVEPAYSAPPPEIWADWTDQAAPRTARDLDEVEFKLNDALVIADELERDP